MALRLLLLAEFVRLLHADGIGALVRLTASYSIHV